jgi:hypothetical protein
METNYGTLSETINALRKEGYLLDFNLQTDCVVCHNNEHHLSAEDFEIDAVFRFDGQTDPDDEAIVYAISSKKQNAKGVLVNGYGVYNDEFSSVLIEKLRSHSF